MRRSGPVAFDGIVEANQARTLGDYRQGLGLLVVGRDLAEVGVIDTIELRAGILELAGQPVEQEGVGGERWRAVAHQDRATGLQRVGARSGRSGLAGKA